VTGEVHTLTITVPVLSVMRRKVFENSKTVDLASNERMWKNLSARRVMAVRGNLTVAGNQPCRRTCKKRGCFDWQSQNCNETSWTPFMSRTVKVPA